MIQAQNGPGPITHCSSSLRNAQSSLLHCYITCLFCRTLGIIKPDVADKFNQILETIYDQGFRITKMKMCKLSRAEAGEFYQEHQAKSFYK